jgi:CBS domain containing-hemolysin-like protein
MHPQLVKVERPPKKNTTADNGYMQKLFDPETSEATRHKSTESSAPSWSTTILGFVGSAIIFWIVLRAVAPVIAAWLGMEWISKLWVRAATASIAALLMAALLSRIEGTIWGKYYVIAGYLLSLALVVWIVLHLLHYI